MKLTEDGTLVIIGREDRYLVRGDPSVAFYVHVYETGLPLLVRDSIANIVLVDVFVQHREDSLRICKSI